LVRGELGRGEEAAGGSQPVAWIARSSGYVGRPDGCEDWAGQVHETRHGNIAQGCDDASAASGREQRYLPVGDLDTIRQDEDIGRVAADQRVVARVRWVARPGEEDVLAGARRCPAPNNQVGPGTAEKNVIAAESDENVVAAPPFQSRRHVVITGEDVVAHPSYDGLDVGHAPGAGRRARNREHHRGHGRAVRRLVGQMNWRGEWDGAALT